MSIGNITSALKASNTEANIIGENLARTNIPGASVQDVNYITVTYGNGQGAAVKIKSIERVVDQTLVSNIRSQNADTGACAELDYYMDNLQQIFGKPKTKGTLSNILASFQQGLINLSKTPNSNAKCQTLVSNAQNLTNFLNKAASQLQNFRQSAESDLNQGIAEVNSILQNIQQLNASISYNYAAGYPIGPMLDERDKYLNQLSSYLDIQVTQADNLSVSIRAAAGGQLLASQASTISYATSPGATPGTVFQPIMLMGQDLTAALKANGKGQLAAFLDVRDTTIVQLQSELDLFSQTLRDQMNAIHNEGTAFTALNSLTGNRVINLTDTFAGTGTVRFSVLDSTGTIQGIQDLDLGSLPGPTTVQTLVNAINSGTSGITASVVNHQLVLQANNPAYGLGVVSLNGAHVTSTGQGLMHYFGLNDFFVTPSNFYGQPNLGVSNNIAVSQNLLTSPSRVSVGQLINTLPIPSIGNRGTSNGDATTINAMNTLLEANLNFAPAGRLSPQTVPLGQYATNMLADIASYSATTKTNAKSEQGYLNALQATFERTSKPTLEDSIMSLEDLAMRRSALLKCVETYRKFLEGIQRI